ncbi:MAG: sugar kinase [Pseudomonadota bacterium]
MTQNRIVGIGECMVEFAPDSPGMYRQSFAGDVLNTLWYARRGLGSDWTLDLCSAVGEDPISDHMLAFLEQAGIRCDAVRRIPDRRPGLYMIQLKDGERSFSYWRDVSAARLLASDPEHLKDKLADARMIYFSGITMAILSEEDADTLLSALRVFRSEGTLIAFDPNLRPALWASPEQMRARITEAAKVADIVFPSFDDEAAGFGDATPRDTMERYAGSGAKTVVLKNGAAAVETLADGAFDRFDTTPVKEMIDSTGAGDSFNGAFLAEFVRSSDLAAAILAGQTCAAAVVQHRGALMDA